jgi:hypothetical protein
LIKGLFADGDDFSWETIQKDRVFYFQKQLVDEIRSQMSEMISLLTATLNIYLNVSQKFFDYTPEMFLSLETVTVRSLLDKQIGEAEINFPLK